MASQTLAFDKQNHAARTAISQAQNSLDVQQTGLWDLWMRDVVPSLTLLRLVASEKPKEWKETEKLALSWVKKNRDKMTTQQQAAFDAVWTQGRYEEQWPAEAQTSSAPTQAEISSDVEGSFSFSD